MAEAESHLGRRLRLCVLLSGRGSNAEALRVATGEADYPAEIVLVGSDRPKAEGLLRAQAQGLATWGYEEAFTKSGAHALSAFESALLAVLDEYRVEGIALAGFMRILSGAFLQKFEASRGGGRIVNIHPSLLPEFKGMNAPEQAIRAGAKTTGASVHLVSEAVDSGTLLAQEAVAIRADDTPQLLHRRIQAVEHRIYPKAIRAWAEGLMKGSPAS